MYTLSNPQTLTLLGGSGSADEILNSYIESVGGRDRILNDGFEDVEKEKKPRGKKRGRASTATATPDNKTNGKKARKESSHPASSTPPASKTKVAWTPPTGSWEDDVREISACEGTDGEINVYLTWNSGHRTQHSLEQIYKRCPQKVSIPNQEAAKLLRKSPDVEVL